MCPIIDTRPDHLTHYSWSKLVILRYLDQLSVTGDGRPLSPSAAYYLPVTPRHSSEAAPVLLLRGPAMAVTTCVPGAPARPDVSSLATAAAMAGLDRSSCRQLVARAQCGQWGRDQGPVW